MDASEQLKKIIDDLLDLACIEAHEVRLACEALDCREVMTEVYRTLEIAAKQREIVLGTDTAADLPAVHADRGRLIQVLLNLGSNAIKYNVTGGSTRLAAFAHEGMVRFLVRDTGKGIHPDYHEQVFEPFNRLGAEQGPEGGAGVGLAVSRRLVHAMGGRIGFESEPGAGTQFWVDLPMAEAAASAPGAPRPQPASAGDGRQTILYLEDRLPSIALMRNILAELHGAQFLEAQTVRDGIAIARSARPDLVITDIHLPDGSGFELLRRLRADPRTEHIPVVALTADAMAESIRQMVEAGFDHVLTKPFAIADLMQIVRAKLKAA